MQCTPGGPGIVAYWCFPDFCSETFEWLIVHVLLSRPRSLATLRSVGLARQESKKKHLIESGAPEHLVQNNFHNIFNEKLVAFRQFAREAVQRFGLLPHLLQVPERFAMRRDAQPAKSQRTPR